MKIKVKYVVEDTDRHGNVRLYFRKRGERKIRLPGPVGAPEFWAAYNRAKAGKPAPKPAGKFVRVEETKGSFEWLCHQYFHSAAFKRLNDRTKYVRRGILDRICMFGGALPADQLTTKHIRRWRDERAEKPEAANGMIKALRQVYAFAVEYELVEHNPARDVSYLSSHSEGFHAWSLDEVHRFEDVHPIGSKARLAFALLLYTGQRQSL